MASDKFDIDISAVRKLAKLLEETGLSEIEYAEGNRKIRCVGRAQAVQVAAPAAPAPAPAPQAAEAKKEITGTSVTAPMVGTVYLSSSPDAAPFVKEGDKIKQGDTLLIIEAMKVMNPIKAPKAGVVARILVENATPIEYGETLIVIE